MGKDVILLKNVDLYTPKHMGVTDVLVVDGKIKKISKNIKAQGQIIDCKGEIACPAFVDGHEHWCGITYTVEGILKSGVGTAIGVLADERDEQVVKILQNVVTITRAKGLESYCLAGSKNYVFPLDKHFKNPKVIGIKTALFQPQRPKANLSYEKLKADAITAYKMQQEKSRPMQLHIHLDHPFGRGEQRPSIEDINSGKLDNLGWIDQIVKETGVPYSLFKLTHAQKYYDRILEYANKGCFVDYTAFDGDYDPRFDSLINAIKNNKVDLSKISISSDLGINSMERGSREEQRPTSLLNTLKKLLEKGLTLEQVLPMLTSNVGILINDKAGKIQVGGKAKLLILDKKLNIKHNLLIKEEVLEK